MGREGDRIVKSVYTSIYRQTKYIYEPIPSKGLEILRCSSEVLKKHYTPIYGRKAIIIIII